MSLLEDLAVPHASGIGPRCYVAKMLLRLDEPERSAVRTEVMGDRLDGKELAKRLQSHGIDIAGHSINRHRRGECRCPRF